MSDSRVNTVPAKIQQKPTVSFFRRRRNRKLLTTAVIFAIIAYFAYVTTPEEITERHRQHVPLLFFRLIYYYPNQIFDCFGINSWWQVGWSRISLKSSSALFWLPSWFQGGIKQTYDVRFSNVPVRIYVPDTRSNNGAIVFIHGGGFVLLDVDSYDHVLHEFVRKTGMVAVSIDYRLAPEHIFPAGLNDCENALVSLLTKEYRRYDIDPTKVVIMGDSAGGNLATVVALRLRNNRDVPPLKLQVLIYPWIQFVDFLTPSYQLARRLTDGSGLLDTNSLARFALVYFGMDTMHMPTVLKNNHTLAEVRSAQHFKYLDHNILPSTFKRKALYEAPSVVNGDAELYGQLAPFLFNPDVSPIMSPDLSGLPKSLVVTCEFDPLRDDGYWYYDRLKKEGVDASWIHYEQGFHAMLNVYSGVELARRAYDEISSFILNNIE